MVNEATLTEEVARPPVNRVIRSLDSPLGAGTAASGWEALTFGVLATVLYWISGPAVPGDMWPPLAEAFVAGRLHLDHDREWLELVPRLAGGQYVPLPPVPALLLVPAALVTGPGGPFPELDGNTYGSIVGGANVALAFLMLEGWGVSSVPRRWLTVGFALATHWWVAGMAGPHHFAQLAGVLFLLIALNLAVRGRWPMAAGLAVGLAAGSRLPMGLALPVVLGLYGGGWRPHRSWLPIVAGVAGPAIVVAWYNLARFGSPFDFGYAHIPSGDSGVVTDEPWFRDGLLSISYIPQHLKVMFLDGLTLVGEPPFFRPSLSGASLLLTTPFLFWAVASRDRLTWLLWLGVLLVMLPNITHGSWGFAQFGYRFILDAVPLLLLLVGAAFRDRIHPLAIATIVIGAAVHLYGLWVINVLNFTG